MSANIHMNSHAKLRVLLIELEFTTWRTARHWSYASQLGIEEGLRANGVEYFTITTPWLSQAQKICIGKHFDQVWIEIVHYDYNKAFLEWVAGLAPVRIGLMAESLEYYPEEYAVFPILKERRNKVEGRFKYITHVVAGDEKDVDNINRRGQVPAFWWPQAVPERFICKQATMGLNRYAVFSGALYGERSSWIECPDLKGLLVHLPSSEHASVYPVLFDKLHGAIRRFLRSGLPGQNSVLPVYLYFLRCIRRRCFALWLEEMRTGCAVVNLPHYVKSYPGRVVEAMAGGQPVISWEISNRPRTKALFEDGVEILLYSNPTELAAQIQRVLSNPDFGQRIAENARRKLMCFHTIEKRVQQILNWVEAGELPTYV